MGQSNPFVLARVALALVLGTVGGAVFVWLSLPLPWMLGAIVANVAGSLLMLPLWSPLRIRRIVAVIIGLMLGSSFGPDTLDQLTTWIASMSMLVVYLMVSACIVVPYYRWVGGMDPLTAFFAGMPGGLAEMTFLGQDMGADDRLIVMAHAGRVVVVVLLVAMTARFIPGYDPTQRLSAGVSFSQISLTSVLALTIAGIAGFYLARSLRLPAYHLIGPMFCSAVLHVSGIVDQPPPKELVAGAQVVLGTIVGCRFIGTKPRQILRALILGMGATCIMLMITVLFAVLLYNVTGQNPVLLVLAYSPGGLAEMSLVALALGENIAFVAAHHLARISFVVLVAPLALTGWNRWRNK